MHINLEAADHNSIQAYSDQEVQVGSSVYQSSLIISRHEIISEWPIMSIQQLNEESLLPLLRHQPKIIIIGHKEQGKFAPQPAILALANRRIGLEAMSIGAACRTFNVLLNEQRDVVIGLII